MIETLSISVDRHPKGKPRKLKGIREKTRAGQPLGPMIL